VFYNLKLGPMFSKACEYAIRAAIFIASESEKGNRASLKDIAREIDSPEAFTAKTLQKLSRSGIIVSTKGAHGGFQVNKEDLEKIMISQIVLAIDGDKVYTRCSLGLHDCSEDHPCPFHSRFQPVRHGLKEIVEKTSLRDLTSGLVSGDTFLKI
jgi:Rrf2 family transcriptional regulator, iron-sulfur cluster assembly transcription factor